MADIFRKYLIWNTIARPILSEAKDYNQFNASQETKMNEERMRNKLFKNIDDWLWSS